MQAHLAREMKKRNVKALDLQLEKIAENMKSIKLFEAVLEEGVDDAEEYISNFMEEWSKLDVRSAALSRANRALKSQNKRIRNLLSQSGCKLPEIVGSAAKKADQLVLQEFEEEQKTQR